MMSAEPTTASSGAKTSNANVPPRFAAENVVPLRTRLGLWPARLLGEELIRRAQSALPTHLFGVDVRPGPKPIVSRELPPLNFEGEAMRWGLVTNKTGNAHLEVELCREPCNEIGTTALSELELLATLIRRGAGGARAMIFYSSVERGFCAGADLRELHAGLVEKATETGGLRGKVETAVEVRGFIDRIHAVFDTFDTAPITTISAVHGFVFGGGFELALTSDVIIADKSARFAFPELRLGIVPGFGGIPRLKRDLGNALVRDLLLTGRSMRASRAHEVGLVSQLVARGRALDAARSVAEQASRFDPETTARAKAFTKPLPVEELAREKDLFVSMLGSPTVQRALEKFVNDESVRPYLP